MRSNATRARAATTVALFLTAITAALLASRAAHAFPGDLDTTFGGGGLVTTPFGNYQDANDVVIQPDGRIVAAGGRDGNGSSDFCLARFNPDGALDPSFDGDGKVTTDFDGNTDVANALLLQTNGKLVAVGLTVKPSTGERRIGMVRYNADGSLDVGFGILGKVIISLGASTFANAYGAVEMPDGGLIAGGYAYDFSTAVEDVLAVRVDEDGDLDPTFGNGGIARHTVTGSPDIFAITAEPDGKVILAGRRNNDGLLVRLTAAGALDPTFDGDGVVQTDIGGVQNDFFDVAVQPDGKIVAAGFLAAGSNWDVTLARYLSSGALDTTFASGGKAITDFGNLDESNAILLQPDGKIIVAGASQYSFILARYQPSGFLDTSFGSGGKVYTSFGSGVPGRIMALERQPDGAIVAAGGIGSFAASRDLAVARYQDTEHSTSVTAATGTWTFALGTSPGGTLTFDDRDVKAFGYSFNLGTSVGSMPYAGSVTNYNGSAGTLDMSASSPLAFSFSGDFVCPPSGCFSTDPVSVFALADSIGGAGLPPSVKWRFTSSDFIYDGVAGRWEGTFTLEAIAPANTPTGSNVTVSGSYTTVTFSSVSGAGTTVINPIGSAPGPLPSNFHASGICFFNGLQQVDFYYDITTDAVYTPPIEVCFEYSQPGPPPCVGVTLLHRVGTSWDTVALTDVPAKHAYCGTVMSLSPFALGQMLDAPSGLVPPDLATQRCESKLATALGTLALGTEKCRAKAADKARLGQAFDAPGCEVTAKERFDRSVAGLEDCPCALAHAPALRDATVAGLSSADGALYCSGSVPLQGGFGFVPPDAAASACGRRLTRAAGKLAQSLVKCTTMAAHAAVLGTTFDRQACAAAARDKYDLAASSSSTCPVCAAANADSVRGQIELLVDREIHAGAYCAGTTPLP